jgi:ubiquinone/menaquinone biosynthesis C-methylase UbiE
MEQNPKLKKVSHSAGYGRSLMWRPVSMRRIKRHLYEIARLRGCAAKNVRVVEVCNGVSLYAVTLSRYFSVSVFDPDASIVKHIGFKFVGSDVRCEQANQGHLPIKIDSVDMVIVHSSGQTRVALQQACQEAYRISRQGSMICVVNIEPAQLVDGFWYSKLMPEALHSACLHHVPTNEVVNEIHNAGYRDIVVHSPHHPVIVENYYTDPDVFLSGWYQKADPICCWAAPTELAKASEQVRDLIHRGEIQQQIEQHQALHNPQVSLVFGFIPFMH